MDLPSALPKICTCIGHPDESELAALAFASCDSGESFLELRIDMLAEPGFGPGIVRRVRERYPQVSLIATCRRRANGGEFDGSIDQEAAILRSAVDSGAQVVDIEIESIEEAPRSLDAVREAARTIVSYHNFKETPDLRSVVQRLQQAGANILKVATQVNRPSDNLKLLDLCRDHPNVVVAGMGETGTPARLLSLLRGGLFTYASPDACDSSGGRDAPRLQAAPTASGQVAASSVRRLFRVEDGNQDTKVYAVIAKPVGHSMSPLIHNRAFNTTSFDGIYVPLLVEPAHLGDFFETLRAMPISGVSVTIPHKQAVIPYLDSVDRASEGIGAVNTIYWKQGKLVGTNTDAIGITAPLGKRVKLDRARVLVVGNGGAAKAAIVALRQQGSEVFVTGRNPDRVESLARIHGAESVTFQSLGDHYFDVLVQATPVGMLPNVRDSLFRERIPADVVFDLVYNPLETALLKHAADQGKVVISGIEMFVEQAAAQFRIWTGLEAPRQVMRDAVLERTVK